MVDWAGLLPAAPWRWLLILLAVAGCASAVARAGAQDLRYLVHQSWTTSDGLPQASVHAIAQTPDGFLWIATEEGLARYDGAQFRVYDRATVPEMPSNDLCCLAVADDGTLWVGTGNGLFALRDGQAVPLPQQAPFVGAGIRSVHRTGGSLSVVTIEGSTYTVDRRGARLVPPVEAGGVGRGIPVDSSGDKQLPLLEADAQGIRFSPQRRLVVGKELPAGRIQAVRVIGDDVWIAMSSGLVVVEGASHQVLRAVPEFGGRSVLSLLEDREGDVWVGTETSGLYELVFRAFRSVEGTSDTGVTAISESPALGVVLGTRDGGLLRWRDGRLERVKVPWLAPDDTILCLGRARDGALWVGTPHGLLRLDAFGRAQSWSSTQGLPDDTIRSVAPISASRAWVGTAHGLAYVDGDKVRSFGPEDGLVGELVGSLLPAGDSAAGDPVWAATDGGLVLVSPHGIVKSYGKAQGLTTPVVAAMARDDSGALWGESEDGWVWTLEGGRIRNVLQLPARRGRPQHVQSMTVLAGTMWMQTGEGVLSASLDRLRACAASTCSDSGRLLTPYDAGQGMPSAESLSVASGGPLLRPDGELWFPTRGGIAATRPQADSSRADIPVVMERFTADDRELPLTAEPELPYGRTRVTLEFAGLGLRDPRAVRYRYKLQGFDHDWIEGGQRRFATYTSLPAGAYTFRVEATLEGQPWSAREATLSFRVTPPFYRRWWFVVLLFFAVAALLGAGYLYRLRLLRRRFAIVLAERNRLAREVHDTLAQDLVSATLQLDLVMMQLGARPLPEGRVERALTQLRSLRKFVGEGLTEARQSIADLRDGSISLDLPSRVRSLLSRHPSVAEIVDVQVEGRVRELRPGVEREVVRIVGEALTNAARHAQAQAIQISLRYLPGELEVEIRDDGRGFSLDTQGMEEGHFGLKGMRERAETLGAGLSVQSSPGDGTTVRLVVRDAEGV